MTGRDVLAQYGLLQTSERLVCPRRGHLNLVHRGGGRAIPARCGQLSCVACLPFRVLDVGSAVGLAAPRWLVTLTQVGSRWPIIHERYTRFRQALKRGGVNTEMAFHVEPNPRGTGTHAHAWAHGGPPRTRELRAAADTANMGSVVLLREIHLPSDGTITALTYGMKACLTVPENGGELAADAREYLDLNGGRLVHASRGFWRDAHGHSLGSQKAAVLAAREAEGLHGRWRWGGAEVSEPVA